MKTFVLGVGAQKSGTTWLSHYLRLHPQADFGMTKEYHVFDLIHLPEFRTRRNNLLLRCAAGLESQSRNASAREAVPAPSRLAGVLDGIRGTMFKALLPEKASRRDFMQMSFIQNPASYFAYFNDILSQGDTIMTGDITPSYSGLEPRVLDFIAKNFAKRNVTVKPIFLMRDPVYRLQSMVRMGFRNRGKAPTLEQEIKRMRQAHQTGKNMVRSSYDRTLANLDQVFGLKNCQVEFYEKVFKEDIKAKLEAFFGFPMPDAPVETEYNVSRTRNDLTEEQYNEFRVEYRDMINGVAEKTGMDLSRIWRWKPPRKD